MIEQATGKVHHDDLLLRQIDSGSGEPEARPADLVFGLLDQLLRGGLGQRQQHASFMQQLEHGARALGVRSTRSSQGK